MELLAERADDDLLQGVNPVVVGVQGRVVIVHNRVQQQVQQEVRPLPLHVPVALPALAGGFQSFRLAGVQGDDVVRPDEDMHLGAALDALLGQVFALRRGPPFVGDHEDIVAVLHHLGPLVALLEVFDGERVEAELGGQHREVVFRRLVNVQPQNAAVAFVLQARINLLRRDLLRRLPVAAEILGFKHRAVHGLIIRSRSGRAFRESFTRKAWLPPE